MAFRKKLGECVHGQDGGRLFVLKFRLGCLCVGLLKAATLYTAPHVYKLIFYACIIELQIS